MRRVILLSFYIDKFVSVFYNNYDPVFAVIIDGAPVWYTLTPDEVFTIKREFGSNDANVIVE